MADNAVIGQKVPRNVLLRALTHKRLAHAYLFHGPDGVGKEAMALHLAQSIVCDQSEEGACGTCSHCKKVASLQHVDLTYVFPAPASMKPEDEQEILESIVNDPYYRHRPWANPSISIERIRQIRQTSAMTSYEGRGKVVIIAEAEAMTQEAANALLKILEEPPPETTIILTSARPTLLLPTITSRSQMIRFEPLHNEEIERALIDRKQISEEQARLISRVANGSYRMALDWLEEDLDVRRDTVLEILRTVIKNDYEQIELVEELTTKFDKKIIKEYLKLMLLWFRDVHLLQHCEDTKYLETQLTNYDRLDVLQNFLGAFESIDFEEVVGELEQAIIRVNRNIQTNLVLTVLFQRIREALRRQVNG